MVSFVSPKFGGENDDGIDAWQATEGFAGRSSRGLDVSIEGNRDRDEW
jgi:hypothetical protein